MDELTYSGIAYRQSDMPNSQWIVTFVTSSEELLSWAGIPRKSEHNLTGFQRPMDPVRVAKAKAFFEMSANQSPTALIIGVPQPRPGQQAAVDLVFDNSSDDKIRPCRLVVKVPDASAPLSEVAEELRGQLQYRLSLEQEWTAGEGQAANLAEADDLDAEDSVPEDGADEEEEDEEILGSDEELDLGVSILSRLLERLDDPAWVQDQEEHIRDLVKPAVIIDGQHRVKGAEACERDIPFTVCAVMNAPWSEEVFQFTVVNYTAKGIPDQFITANAALSLTKTELEELKDRLRQAGVKIIEYELMQVVNFDTHSPFYELVDLSDKRRLDKLGYKTMVQVARGWWDARHQVFSLILENLYPQIKGAKKKTRRVDEWRNADWGDFFLAFWAEVYGNYKTDTAYQPHHTLWDVGHSQLMNTVVLLEFQRAFLDNLNAQDSSYFQVPDGEDAKEFLLHQVSKRAKQFVSYFPSDFFATKWGETSLNVGPGRQHLHDAFTLMVNKKGKYQYAKSALVTGKTE